MDDITLRGARHSDRRAIRTLTLAAYEEYAALMPYWEYYRADIVATLEEAEPGDQIVAEQRDTIVGSVLLYPAGTVFYFTDGTSAVISDPEMRLLAVDPTARGRGIGAALVGECIRKARRSGSRFLVLHTNPIMAAAIRLYERMGFEHRAELDFFVNEDLTIRGYRFDLA